MERRDRGDQHRFIPWGWAILLGLFLLNTWVLNASRVGAAVQGCPQGCAAVGERQEGPLRVMSLKVLHGFPHFERMAGSGPQITWGC